MFGIKKEKKGNWTKVEHASGPIYYRCSNCRAMFPSPAPTCPACRAKMKKKIKYDPAFIDDWSLGEE